MSQLDSHFGKRIMLPGIFTLERHILPLEGWKQKRKAGGGEGEEARGEELGKADRDHRQAQM